MKKVVCLSFILPRVTREGLSARTAPHEAKTCSELLRELTNTPMKHILYIGLDVHKDSIAIAIAESGRNGELRSWGNISNSVPAIEKAIARIRKQYGLEIELHFCYSRAGRDRLHSCSPEGGGSRQRRPLRVCPRPSPPAAWPRVYHRGTIKDPSAIWRQDQNRPARCRPLGLGRARGRLPQAAAKR